MISDDKGGERKLGDAGHDRVSELFFKSRNVLITGEINDKLANRVATRLIALAEDGDDPINVFISSPGGHVESGDMVHDMIKFIEPAVRTIGSGWVASAGALIFVAAKKSNRYCLPNTRFLLHEPVAGSEDRFRTYRFRPNRSASCESASTGSFRRQRGRPRRKSRPTPGATSGSTPTRPSSTGCLAR